MKKLNELQSKLELNKAFLVSNHTNIYYLTGFKGVSETEREGLVLVTKSDAYLMIPRLYEPNVNKKKLKSNGIEVIILDGKGFSDYVLELLSSRVTHLAFESYDLRFSEFENINNKFKKHKKKIKLVPEINFIEEFRTSKTDEEILKAKKAQQITVQTLAQVIKLLENGGYKNYTELTLAEEIRRKALELGAEGMAFDTIVACGKGSALPHYSPQNILLTSNSPLLIDMGIKYKGFCGDLTRTFYIGEPSNEFKMHYEIVKNCNEKMLALLKTQKDFTNIHKEAVNFFEEYEVDDRFIHSIGHGVGLEIHELPSPRRDKKVILKAGNIITIEPGLYFESEYGIRIEDMVLIKENSIEILNKNTFKPLYIID